MLRRTRRAGSAHRPLLMQIRGVLGGVKSGLSISFSGAWTSRTKRRPKPDMKQLTSPEWARMRDRTVTLSLVDRGPVVRARLVEWLVARPGPGWFYVTGDNFHLGVQADADAFRQWMMRDLVA